MSAQQGASSFDLSWFAYLQILDRAGPSVGPQPPRFWSQKGDNSPPAPLQANPLSVADGCPPAQPASAKMPLMHVLSLSSGVEGRRHSPLILHPNSTLCGSAWVSSPPLILSSSIPPRLLQVSKAIAKRQWRVPSPIPLSFTHLPCICLVRTTVMAVKYAVARSQPSPSLLLIRFILVRLSSYAMAVLV